MQYSNIFVVAWFRLSWKR